MGIDVKEKDTYKYHLMLGHKVVHKDICTDWARREVAHQEEFPGSRIKLIGRRTTREAALKWVRQGGRREYKLNRNTFPLVSRARVEEAVPISDCAGHKYSDEEREDLARYVLLGAEMQRDKDVEVLGGKG